MINLVHFYDRPGGIEVLLPGIIKAFNQREFSAFVIRPHSDTFSSVYSDVNVRVAYGSRNNLIAIIRLAQYARKRRNEIFHVFNIGPFFLLILRVAGIKRLIFSIHGTVYWHNHWEKFFFKILWLMAIDHKRNVFTSNSKYSETVFKQKISPQVKCELLYNFIDPVRFCKSSRITDNDKIRKIIYVGRLAQGKGLDRWIEIALAIHHEFPEMVFEIYGAGLLKSALKQKIDISKAVEFIFLKGHVKDIENAFKNADLLLFLSEYESFGNVVVESILCGTPVLVTDIPSLKEILSDFPEFILKNYPPSVEEILRKLSGITYLKEEAEKAGKVFRERFSLDKHIEKLSGIYAKI